MRKEEIVMLETSCHGNEDDGIAKLKDAVMKVHLFLRKFIEK